MLNSIIQFFAEYLRAKPITDVLLIVLIGVFVWNESNHGSRTDNAHKVMGTILQERDANEQKRDDRNERNIDRIIAALTGVKQEVKKIPEAAAVAAEKLVEQKTGSGIQE